MIENNGSYPVKDLDKILDEVRGKYYTSKLLPRPDISWSDDHWTAIYGQYTLYKNEIEISRALDSLNVSYEALSSVVYHESLHQDFAEHDTEFMLRANKFPNYKKHTKELGGNLDNYRSMLKCNQAIWDYTKNKSHVIYAVIPYLENFQSGFTFYNENFYVNTDVEISNAPRDNLTIFLVDNRGKYHIVAWAENAVFYKDIQRVYHHNYGGLDFSYRISVPRDNVKILFDSTCTYVKNKNDFPPAFDVNKFSICSIHDEAIKEDLEYINSYCEGHIEIGISSHTLDLTAPYQEVPYEQLYDVAINEVGARGVWAANALCEMELNYDTIFNRADALRYCGLILLGYEEMKKAYQLSDNDPVCIAELIKLCAMVDDFSLGNQLVKEFADLNTDDEYFNNSVAYLLRQKC